MPGQQNLWLLAKHHIPTCISEFLNLNAKQKARHIIYMHSKFLAAFQKWLKQVYGVLHVLEFLVVASWVTWFFSNWERKNCLQSWANSQNDNHFHSKRQPRTILSENSCHFVNLLIFANSSFFLSLRKITWLNSPKLEDM